MNNRIFNVFIIALLALAATGAAQAERKPPSKLVTVNIYAAKELIDESPYDRNNPSNLMPVKRRVDAKSPLRGALLALTRGLTGQEERQGFVSVTFGLKFVSVRLENGVACAYFTMPEGASFSGDLSPVIFQDAVERTALQFPQVKRSRSVWTESWIS